LTVEQRIDRARGAARANRDAAHGGAFQPLFGEFIARGAQEKLALRALHDVRPVLCDGCGLAHDNNVIISFWMKSIVTMILPPATIGRSRKRAAQTQGR